MCYTKAEGGRCVSETRPGYLKALRAFDSPKRTVEDDHTLAVVEYAATSCGAKAVSRAINIALKEGNLDKSAWLSSALRRGQSHAEAQAEFEEMIALKNNKAKTKAAAGAPVATTPDTSPTPLRLSPSRAVDFKNCELAYRYHTIDKFPSTKTPETQTGTLVHSVLENIYDLPPNKRTRKQASAMLPDEWDRLVEEQPDTLKLLGEGGKEEWFVKAEELLDRYFAMENPAKANPTHREYPVQFRLNDEVTMSGIVDRLDINENGDVRIVDYKTGKSPKLGRDSKALFQLKFYALVMYRNTGRVPKVLQLMYMGDGQVLKYEPTKEDLEATEVEVAELSAKIKKARETGEFKPKQSALCAYCNFKDKCPEFGGTVPPMPS